MAKRSTKRAARIVEASQAFRDTAVETAKLTDAEVYGIITTALVPGDVDPLKVGPDTELQKDLHIAANALGLAADRLARDFRRAGFHIKVSGDELVKAKTVGDVFDLIVAKLENLS
ncbi:MAG: hypothetical protein QM754_06840 [Tepidisphaeraceae bacterium]